MALTLAEFAAAKKLPLEFLIDNGLGDFPDGSGVGIGYADVAGQQHVRMRKRTALRAKDGSLWIGPKGVELLSYGLWRLAEAREKHILILVEGETDALTLWLHGFPALGIPGATLAKTLQTEHLAEINQVFVQREPDAGGDTFVAKITARLAQLEFAGEAYEFSIEGFKDANDLHIDNPDDFAKRFQDALNHATPLSTPTGIRISAEAPFDIAEAYIRQTEGRIRHWSGQWWVWSGAEYIERTEQDQRALLGQFLHYKTYLTKIKGKDEIRVEPTSWHLNNAFDALKTCVNLPADIRPPRWLTNGTSESLSIISVANGLLELSTGEVRPHTPDWFNLHALPVVYKPDAECPEWLTFLEQIWPDEASRETLQEMFGYLITVDISQQKAFLIIGPPRSGKGTIGRVLAALLGPDAVTRPALADFGQQFGLEALIGKSLAIVSDARLDRNVAAGFLAERILAISGEDTINIARKYAPSWEGSLSVRFLILANEVPQFQDASGALPKRFIVLRMTKSWLGSEDSGLFDRLRLELPGILNWSMAGWMRLQERGRFIQPTAAAEIAQEMSDSANPMAIFFEEACDFDSNQECTIAQLYRHYLGWAKQWEIKRPLPVTIFGRALRAARAELEFFRPHGAQRRVRGIVPKSWV